MNRRILLVILVFVLVIPVFCQEEAEVLIRIYKRAQSLDQQYAIMVSLIETGGSAVEEVLIEALTDLQATKMNVTGFVESYKYGRLLDKLVNTLGDMKSEAAAPELMRAYRESDDIFIKADAIIAVGKTGVTKYADEFSKDLRNYNIGALKIADKQKLDTLILSFVTSLERLKAPVGFEPVFFASIGNYSKEIRERAFKALGNMVSDPSDLLFGIITRENDQSVIYQAMLAEENSNAPSAGKEQVAVEALRQSITAKPKNSSERNVHIQIRLQAAKMLKELKFTSKDAITFIGRMVDDYIKYKETKYSVDEILAILDTLSVNSSDECARILTIFLEHLSDQREAGAAHEDNRIIIAAIQAIAETGNKTGIEELTRVAYSPDWDASVIREAKKALDKLKK
ncbi:MAG: hypothetical protein JW874_14140 [Spirochaetales bacterium]|nr:hypothetical protein [Spirochaetales bacterium]